MDASLLSSPHVYAHAMAMQHHTSTEAQITPARPDSNDFGWPSQRAELHMGQRVLHVEQLVRHGRDGSQRTGTLRLLGLQLRPRTGLLGCTDAITAGADLPICERRDKLSECAV